MAQMYSIHSDSLPSSTHVVSLRGSEGLSQIYEFEVGLLVKDTTFDMDAAVTGQTTLSVDGGHGQPYLYHGVLASVEHVHEFADQALFRAVLRPRLWHLSLNHHSRVFVGNSVPDILEAILRDNGLSADDYELRLSHSYTPMEHVCQYQESDLAFISRWMEREGIYYYFEQGAASEKLVITDDKNVHTPLRDKAIRYDSLARNAAYAKEAFGWFSCRSATVPAAVQLQDYDYNNPDLDVVGQATIAEIGRGEVSLYGENFLTPSEGERLAKVRGQEYLAGQKIHRASGRVFGLRPGYTFSLEEHARQTFNAPYLTTALEHFGNQSASLPEVKELLELSGDEEYRVRVTAIPATVQYRPARRTSKPRIYGMENAVIDGEEDSPYAQVDDHGCYLVKINFDESDLGDGKASTRVRMLQPHGGGNEGFHFPLRKGTEVMLTFQGGDPDRPVICGVLPNMHKQSPVSKDNASMNVIQTGGMNRIQMEDADGKQHIRLSSPTENTFIHLGAPNCDDNMKQVTDGNYKRETGQKSCTTIGASEEKEVKLWRRVKAKVNSLIGTAHLQLTSLGTMTAEATKAILIKSGSRSYVKLERNKIELNTTIGAAIKLEGDKVIIAGGQVIVKGKPITLN